MKSTGEKFQVAYIRGIWDELYTRDSKRGYHQRCDMSAVVSVHVVRKFSRDRNGKKVETVQQYITGSPDDVQSYLSTFPLVASLRVSSLIDRSGIMIQSQY